MGGFIILKNLYLVVISEESFCLVYTSSCGCVFYLVKKVLRSPSQTDILTVDIP